MDIPRRTREQTFARTTTMKVSGGLKVDEVDSGGDGLSPKVWGNVRSKKKSASGLNDLVVLPFRGAILRISTGTGELRKRAMGSKEIAKLMRKVFPPSRSGKYEWKRRTEYEPWWRK